MKKELIKGFTRNDVFLKLFLGDKKDEYGQLTITNSNNIAWILGHLVYCRGKVISALGGEFQTFEYEDNCGRGVEKKTNFTLSIKQVLHDLIGRGEMITELIESKTGDDLSVDIGKTFPDGSSDLEGLLTFMAWHEAFHLGQIDMIQIGNGIEGIK